MPAVQEVLHFLVPPEEVERLSGREEGCPGGVLLEEVEHDRREERVRPVVEGQVHDSDPLG